MFIDDLLKRPRYLVAGGEAVRPPCAAEVVRRSLRLVVLILGFTSALTIATRGHCQLDFGPLAWVQVGVR